MISIPSKCRQSDDPSKLYRDDNTAGSVDGAAVPSDGLVVSLENIHLPE